MVETGVKNDKNKTGHAKLDYGISCEITVNACFRYRNMAFKVYTDSEI